MMRPAAWRESLMPFRKRGKGSTPTRRSGSTVAFPSKRFPLLLGILLTSLRAFAGDLPELGWRLNGDAFLRFGEGIETAHTPWASPAASGRIRALILANQDGACDVPELARRLDVNVKGMPSDSWLKQGGSYWLGL